MSKVLVSDTYLKNIANEIRTKNGTVTKYKPSEMAGAINALQSPAFTITIQDTSNQKITLEYSYGNDGELASGSTTLRYAPRIKSGKVEALNPEQYTPGKLKVIGIGGGQDAYFPMEIQSDLTFYATEATKVKPKVDLSYYGRNNITGYGNISEIPQTNIEYLQSVRPTNLAYAFDGGQRILSLNIPNFDTSQCTNMQGCFNNMGSCTSMTLNDWDVSNVQYFNSAFSYDASITSLNLNQWHGKSVKSTQSMFLNMRNLVAVDISNLFAYTSIDSTMIMNMFYGCSQLRYIILNTNNPVHCSTSGTPANMGLGSSATILVPSSLVSAYKSDFAWGNISDKIDSISNYNISRTASSVTVTPKQ